MTNQSLDVRPLEDPEARLERSLIEDFLRSRGQDRSALEALPEEERAHLLAGASMYAAGKLAEIEARSRFVRGMHEARDGEGTGRVP